jgi:hypothetical protein
MGAMGAMAARVSSVMAQASSVVSGFLRLSGFRRLHLAIT